MRFLMMTIAIGAACAACDDSTYVNPAPHDSGAPTDAATNHDGSGGTPDGGVSDAAAE